MSSMGFSRDPGPLPFVTIRRDTWANRLADLPRHIRIHGEHGCDMPRGIAIATKVEPYAGDIPSHLVGVYTGIPLFAVHLDAPTPCAGAHAWDWEWGTCAHCGEPNPTPS